MTYLDYLNAKRNRPALPSGPVPCAVCNARQAKVMMGRCPKCEELLAPLAGDREKYVEARAEIRRRIEEGTWWPDSWGG